MAHSDQDSSQKDGLVSHADNTEMTMDKQPGPHPRKRQKTILEYMNDQSQDRWWETNEANQGRTESRIQKTVDANPGTQQPILERPEEQRRPKDANQPKSPKHGPTPREDVL